MKTNKIAAQAFGLIALLFFAGCAGTIPVTYSPQNFVRFKGDADIGDFVYMPAVDGRVKANQIQNSALGSIYIATDIADLVKRATALELEKSGVLIGDKGALKVSGEILEFKAADLGYSVDWSYSIRYKITRKADSTILLDKVYTADPKKTGKFGAAADFAPSVNGMILSGYEKFARDPDARQHLEKKD